MPIRTTDGHQKLGSNVPTQSENSPTRHVPSFTHAQYQIEQQAASHCCKDMPRFTPGSVGEFSLSLYLMIVVLSGDLDFHRSDECSSLLQS